MAIRKNQIPRNAEPAAREQSDANRADLVDKAIHSIEAKLGSSEVKATFADFIRLLQLQRNCKLTGPRKSRLHWIDFERTESVSEE